MVFAFNRSTRGVAVAAYGEYVVDAQLGNYHRLTSTGVAIDEALEAIFVSLHVRSKVMHVCGTDITVSVTYSAVEVAPVAVVVTALATGESGPELNLRQLASKLGMFMKFSALVCGPIVALSDGSNGLTFNLVRV